MNWNIWRVALLLKMLICMAYGNSTLIASMSPMASSLEAETSSSFEIGLPDTSSSMQMTTSMHMVTSTGQYASVPSSHASQVMGQSQSTASSSETISPESSTKTVMPAATTSPHLIMSSSMMKQNSFMSSSMMKQNSFMSSSMMKQNAFMSSSMMKQNSFMSSSMMKQNYLMTSSPVAIMSTPSSAGIAPLMSSSIQSIPTTPQPGAKKFVFSFKLANKVCTLDIIENNVKSSEYQELAKLILNAVNEAFKNDSHYTGSRIIRFDCGSVIPVIEISKNVNATGTTVAELKPISDKISSGTFAGYTVDSFSSSPAAPPLPRLYIKMETKLSHLQFCQNMAIFKQSFARFVVTTDGLSNIKTSQIVIFHNKCNDQLANSKIAHVYLYISSSSSVTDVDTEITTRAYKLIKQFSDDGTTWRLGAAFDEKLQSLELVGKDKQEETAYSELTIVLIGMGATFGLLLLIIIIILIISSRRRKARDEGNYNAVTIENKRYGRDTHPHSRENEAFERAQVNVDGHDYEYPSAPTSNREPPSVAVNNTASYQELEPPVKHAEAPPHYEPLSAEEEERTKVKVEPEDGAGYTVAIFKPEARDLTPSELAQRKDNDSFMKGEFESLVYDMPSSNIYPSQTMEKNRLMNIIPRPETRIVLEADASGSDYINATHARDNQSNKKFIITQAPLQRTIEDFWRMIVEQDAHVIVMVTPLVQEGMEKCFQYWPPDSVARTYGDIQVQLSKKELKPDFTVTTMTVKARGESREIVLYRYMTWPEENIPESVRSFLAFLLEARKTNAAKGENSKLVVHCSDGVGMSAVFVAIANGIASLEQKGAVDVYSLVKTLRKDRAGAVDHFSQYKFIYQALYEYALRFRDDQAGFENQSDVTSSM